MIKKTGICLLWILLITAIQGAEIFVNSLADFQTAINGAEPGDEIVLANGVYSTSDEIMVASVQGEKDNWIVIRSEVVGGAEITGEHSFYVSGSSYIRFDGFKITQNVEDKCFSIYGSEYLRVSNCSFDLVEDGSKSYWLYISGEPCPQHIRIDHNEFAEKYDEGCFIVIYGPDEDISKYITIDHNHFQGQYFDGDNGGEAIRYGDSNRQNFSSYAVIEENLFEHCDGDCEVISVKSTNLTVRRNTLRECNGSIVLRHGDSCRVESNFILNGDGGIRFYGDYQEIIGNYICNNGDIKPSGERSTVRGALCVGAGDVADLKNGQNTYDQPDNCIVAYNTLVYNTGVNLNIGVMGNSTYPPTNLTIANNIIVSDVENCVTISQQPVNAAYFGNILFGSAGAGEMPADGYVWADPDMSIESGVYHLNGTSPAIDSAQEVPGLGEYITDIDGHLRNVFDIGADEFSGEEILYRPLTAGDVGPEEHSIYCATTDEIQEAMKNAVAGDRIIIAGGTYISDGSNSGSSLAYFFSDADGTASAPIYLFSEDTTNRAVLSGTSEEHDYVLYITGDYWKVEGLEVITGNKGIMLDNADHVTISNVIVHETGQEGIHIRDGSSYCLIDSCRIYNTGKVITGYGEGIYVGSAVNHWDEYNYEHFDVRISNCHIGPDVTAEHIDIKEGTTGTIVENCYFDGTGITGDHYADSFLDVKGNHSIIRDNIGYRMGNNRINTAFQVHQKAEVWGVDNIFLDNEVYLDNDYLFIVNVSSGSAIVSGNIRHPEGNMYTGNYIEYDNVPPSVSFISDLADTVFMIGETVTVQAEAGDVDGYITLMEFYLDDLRIGEDERAPYELSFNCLETGLHSLWLKVMDNDSSFSISDTIEFTVISDVENNFKISIDSAGVTASADDGNGPENTVDGNFGTRWSADGDGSWLQFDLGRQYILSHINIAFYKGDQRVAYFRVQVSENTDQWITVIADGESSGLTEDFQLFPLSGVKAGYVRLLGYGNSENSWNSILEVEIWATDSVQTVTGVDPGDPNEFSLNQNYPNPFNPETNIEFSLDEPGNVCLKVYDIRGKLVDTIIDNQQYDAGFYFFLYNAKNLPSGVYFYRLISGDYVKTRKMTLLR